MVSTGRSCVINNHYLLTYLLIIQITLTAEELYNIQYGSELSELSKVLLETTSQKSHLKSISQKVNAESKKQA